MSPIGFFRTGDEKVLRQRQPVQSAAGRSKTLAFTD